jgi:hypothetical protein
MKKFTVDFVEGSVVTLLEKGNECNKVIFRDQKLSESVQDGNIVAVILNEDGTIKSFEIMQEEAYQVKKENEDLLKKILKKSKEN